MDCRRHPHLSGPPPFGHNLPGLWLPSTLIRWWKPSARPPREKLSSLRKEQVVKLPAGEVWIAGDIHDHRNNFRKLIAAADLGNNPQRHLILQELIHGDHYDEKGAEDSWEMLYKAAELKCDFPQQVHFLFANHDLAQIHGEGIMKAGLSVCEAFTPA